MTRSVKRNLLIAGAVVLAVLIVDQVVKIWVKTTFTEIMPNGRPLYHPEEVSLIGDWLKLYYIENQGMAFGTTFGSGMWAKLGLSLFRIAAIAGIGYYWFKQARRGVKTELLIAIGFVFAGATGNLIDSMFYDFIFPFDGCLSFNHLEGSGNWVDCFPVGKLETRHTGFLFGNVVDMFQFDMTWPSWMPWVAGTEVFPAIWNVADASISVGVIMILLRQRVYFANPRTEAQLQQELDQTRGIALFGGLGAIVLYALLIFRVIAVPEQHALKAFLLTLALYILNVYVCVRLARLLNRSALLWFFAGLLAPAIAPVVLSRLEAQAGTPDISAE